MRVHNIAGILLAAGHSRRFGKEKLLHPLPDGTPIAVAAAIPLFEVLPDSIAIVKPGDQELIERFASLGIRSIENPATTRGMGTSLATGISATSGADGWLIALGDMPWIETKTITALRDRLANGASIVAPIFQGRRGHPVGFSSNWLEQLLALSGDRGARELLTTNPDEVELLPVDDPGVILDVDSPRDLEPHSTLSR